MLLAALHKCLLIQGGKEMKSIWHITCQSMQLKPGGVAIRVKIGLQIRKP